jgi:4-amino-4-deoxy-L-arabinose transferase-like glycosyltransferase
MRNASFAAALAAVAALWLALRAPVADLPFERDEGEYAYVAQRWLAGELPYRDAFDQKPPGAFAFYALAFATLGESPAAVRWAAQLLGCLTLFGVGWLGRRLFAPEVGIAAAAAAGLLTADPSWLGNAVNTEVLAIAPLTAGALAARRAGGAGGAAMAFATGALGAAACLCKPVAAPIAAFELATAAACAARAPAGGLLRGTQAALAAALGFAAVLAPVGAYFARHGAFADFLDATLWFNLAYAGDTPLADYPAYFWAQFRGSLPALGPLYAAAAAAPLWATARARRPGDAAPRAGRLAWTGAWLAVSFVAVSAGGYFRQHYYVLAAPPLALLAGAGLVAAARLARRAGAGDAWARWAAPLAAAAIVAHALARNAWYFAPGPAAAKLERLYGSNPFPESPPLGRWLAERSSPDQRIFVYGSEPQLLFYAGRRSATRYMFVYPLTMPLPAVAARQREALDALRADPPRFVVGVFNQASLLEQPGTPPDLERGLRALLEQDYELVAVVPYERTRSGRVVEGAAARALWRERPLWDGGALWAAFVVWERRAR